jgi:hypothetical protein
MFTNSMPDFLSNNLKRLVEKLFPLIKDFQTPESRLEIFKKIIE